VREQISNNITPEILLEMEKAVNKSDRNENMFYAASLLAFYTLFRKANLAAPTPSIAR
jgi:hypothetical protein